jgi:hypothetical protein
MPVQFNLTFVLVLRLSVESATPDSPRFKTARPNPEVSITNTKLFGPTSGSRQPTSFRPQPVEATRYPIFENVTRSGVWIARLALNRRGIRLPGCCRCVVTDDWQCGAASPVRHRRLTPAVKNDCRAERRRSVRKTIGRPEAIRCIVRAGWKPRSPCCRSTAAI